jgi:hypothetical protein
MNMDEESRRRRGKLLRKLRDAQGMSRAGLLANIHRQRGEAHLLPEARYEAWVARGEDGLIINLSREDLEMWIQGLNCTTEERAQVLLHSDRSVLTTGEDPTPIEELLNYVMAELHIGGNLVLAGMLAKRDIASLTKAEMFEIVAAVLTILAQRSRKP